MSFLLNLSDVLNYAGEGSIKFIEGKNIVFLMRVLSSSRFILQHFTLFFIIHYVHPRS